MPSKWKDYCARITLYSSLFCVCCGFLGGMRANNVFSDAIDLVVGGLDAVVVDASEFTQAFPEQIQVVADSVRLAVKSSLKLTPSYLDNTQIVSTIRDPAGRIVATLSPANTAFGTLSTNAPLIDSMITDIRSKISALNSILSSISSQLTTINAVQNRPGSGTYQLTSPISDSVSTEQSALSTIDTDVSACTNTNSFSNQMTASGVSGQSSFFTTSRAIVTKWTDINAEINTILTSRSESVYAAVLPTVNSFLNPTVEASSETSSQMNATLVICSVFKWPKFLKFLFWATPFFVMVILLLGAVLFLLAVAFADVCQIFTDKDASSLVGLSPSIANATTNFFKARQKDCIDSDLGYIKLATDMGLVTDTSGNFTELAAPTINGLDLSLLGQLLEIQVIQSDTISGPAGSLQSNLCALSISTISSANADSMAQTVQILLDDINSHAGSSATPPSSEFTIVSGSALAYSDLTDFTTLLNALHQSITTWKSSLVAINADVSQLTNMYSQFSTSAGVLATALPSTMSSDYSSVYTALTAYATSATGILTQNIPNTKYQILKRTEAARVKFEASLPCKNIGHDTIVFQNALCDAFFFCFAGLGYAFLLWCFPMITNRVARKRNAKVAEEATDEEAISPAFGKLVEEDDGEDGDEEGYDDSGDGLPTPNPPTPQPRLNTAGVQRGASPKPEYHTTLPNAASF
ncbi:hypothetical protein BDR26DRAFT_895870 [Obelidium mucronatum]|nr:hypothetical protein BDR26DRAFT_895870 [Obelidium mucronatum]